ncbi:MAG: endonuclease/exonuclease/phosphatase family protein [marine benthic group bacterium]|nr:endonuclease/exonuclease/phosphatase family protein [Gemmatimonadota bacterium]
MKRMMTFLTLICCLLAGVGACGDDILGPEDPDPQAGIERAGSPEIGLMTWNLYVGSEIESIANAGSLEELVYLAGLEWASVQATDFRERAEAIADAIVERNPHAIALQEVSRFTLRAPSIYTGSPGEWVEHTDYLDILLAKLSDRGVSYVPAAVVDNFGLEVPALLGMNPATDLVDIRLEDMDVVLVRGDLPWHSVVTANYADNPSLIVGGQELEITRGYASVVMEVKGLDYRVVSTHLTPREEGETEQLAQADELIAWLDGSEVPTFVMGDLNTAPGNTWTDSYGKFTDAGFADLWTLARPDAPGPTCCQDNDLLNSVSLLDRRFDLVFYRNHRNPVAFGETGIAGEVLAERLGADPSEKTPSNLWPSDHAGVTATVKPIPGVGQSR